MQITVKKLKLTNFKGARNVEIEFNPVQTYILGGNAVGKTTIFDAFTWVLFGKDSLDRKDFEIKTYDESGAIIPQIDHEVEVELKVDNQVITLRKVLREIWAKRRGSAVTEMTGNEIMQYWNDVPMKQKEFQDKINSMVDEGLFKLITNPLYFNSVLKWQDRRHVLFSMSESISDTKVLDAIATNDNRHMIDSLITLLNQSKSIADIKKEYTAKKKKIKDELDLIPTRIDEANRSMPQLEDYDLIQSNIDNYTKQIAELNASKDDLVKNQQVQNKAILDKQNELNDLKMKLQKLNFDASSKRQEELSLSQNAVRSLDRKIADKSSEIQLLKDKVERLKIKTSSLEVEAAKLREEWNILNSKPQPEVSEDQTCCPSCTQRYPDDKINEIKENLISNFLKDKKQKLDEINNKGVDTVNQIKNYNDELKQAESNIVKYESELAVLKEDMNNLLEHNNKVNQHKIEPSAEVIELEKQIEGFVIPVYQPTDFTEINKNISYLQDTINAGNRILASKSQREMIIKRIDSLKEDEKRMAQELAELESTEFVLESFNKKRIEMMESSVNGKFKNVRFKLFDQQINGGESECCETLVNTNGAWVPFSSGNKAGQINAGIDIINALCSHHNVYAPIFIDNRESVNELIETNSQVVNLVVTNDQLLTISNHK